MQIVTPFAAIGVLRASTWHFNGLLILLGVYLEFRIRCVSKILTWAIFQCGAVSCQQKITQKRLYPKNNTQEVGRGKEDQNSKITKTEGICIVHSG